VAQNEPVYIKLQKHLDDQAVGFPATRSGAEIKILKHIFTPEEAEIACCLSDKFEPLETIFSRAGQLVASSEELETWEDLRDIIMEARQGRLGKLKLTGKLIVDAIRTGRMDLLKP
jgi:hypothetical protein